MEDLLDNPDIISADDIFSGAPAAVAGEVVRPGVGTLKQVSSPAPAAPIAVATSAPVSEAKKLSVKETVIALFRETEPGLRALAERYREVVYDVKTAKGLKECKAARHDLRENGRYAVQRAEDAIKKELNGAKVVVTNEVARLVAITKATEDGYDALIVAREAEIEAEKAEAARLEQVAQDENAARCARLTGTVVQAEGRTSEQIGNAIAHIEALVIDPGKWGGREDFVKAGQGAKETTLAALRKLKIEAKTAEDNAALRAENARLAAELAERQRAADEAAAAQRKAEDVARAAAQAAADELAAEEAKAAEIARLQKVVATAAPAPVVAEPPAAEPAPAPAQGRWQPTFRAPAAAAAPAEPAEPAESVAEPLLVPSTVEQVSAAERLPALLEHIAKAFAKFPTNPKVSPEWWAELRRLADDLSTELPA